MNLILTVCMASIKGICSFALPTLLHLPVGFIVQGEAIMSPANKY